MYLMLDTNHDSDKKDIRVSMNVEVKHAFACTMMSSFTSTFMDTRMSFLSESWFVSRSDNCFYMYTNVCVHYSNLLITAILKLSLAVFLRSMAICTQNKRVKQIPLDDIILRMYHYLQPVFARIWRTLFNGKMISPLQNKTQNEHVRQWAGAKTTSM